MRELFPGYSLGIMLRQVDSDSCVQHLTLWSSFAKIDPGNAASYRTVASCPSMWRPAARWQRSWGMQLVPSQMPRAWRGCQ